MRIATAPEIDSTHGAHKFRNILNVFLRSLGHEVVDWSGNFDVLLTRGMPPKEVLYRTLKTKAKIVVQYGGSDISTESKRILSSILRKADGVVYNSSHGLCWVHEHVTRPSCSETVINNGTYSFEPSILDKPIIMVACDKYDMPSKQKALNLAVLAMPIIKKFIPDAELWVAGKAPASTGADRVLGRITSHDKLQEERRKASLLLHLVEGDNCPNTVLETLGQGIPVVCHANSGVPEIVRWFGEALSDPTPKSVASACEKMLRMGPKLQSSWMPEFNRSLSIGSVARRYQEFLCKVVNIDENSL